MNEEEFNRKKILGEMKRLKKMVKQMEEKRKGLLALMETIVKAAKPLKEYFGEDWSLFDSVSDLADIEAFLGVAEEVIGTAIDLNELADDV